MKRTQMFTAVLLLSAGSLIAATQSLDRATQTLKVDLDLVLVPVSVTERGGQSAMDLEASNFRLWEDRIEQEVIYVSSENVPTSVGVIFDVSDSMENHLPMARAAVVELLEAGHPADEYFLLEFGDSVRLTQDFTRNVGNFQNRVFEASPLGRTALYDGVYRGISHVLQGNNPRKALIIITDGEDNHSRYSLRDIEDYVRESDVLIYAIGISATFGKSTLHGLADLTGGRAVFTGSAEELESICRQIALEIQSQYLLGYLSSNQEPDGRWRQIRVGVEPLPGDDPLTVRARRGYYASGF